jgi:hypothetical protein
MEIVLARQPLFVRKSARTCLTVVVVLRLSKPQLISEKSECLVRYNTLQVVKLNVSGICWDSRGVSGVAELMLVTLLFHHKMDALNYVK